MDAGHELLRRAAVNPQVLQWHTWAALKPGPSLVVLGAVHGNETCGAHAIVRAIDDLQHGRLLLRRGRLTLVPVANPLAFGKKTREGERNLNRRFMPRDDARDYEDHVTRQLAPVLASHDALLDLHSFHTAGEPFAMVGPRNNEGTREPFMRAQEESELARALGVNQIVEGWLDVYDRASHALGKPLDDEGIGTTEYMRSQGGYAVTIECGQHEDPSAIRVAERAIRGALALLGLADVPAPPRLPGLPPSFRKWCCVNRRRTNWCVNGAVLNPSAKVTSSPGGRMGANSAPPTMDAYFSRIPRPGLGRSGSIWPLQVDGGRHDRRLLVVCLQ